MVFTVCLTRFRLLWEDIWINIDTNNEEKAMEQIDIILEKIRVN